MNQEKIGNFIKELRKKEKISQQQFAQKYGVTYQAVSKWENGKSIPDIAIITKMCQEYEIDINDFLETKRANKTKQKIMGVGIICGVIITIFLSTFFFLSKNKTFEFKTLSASCENFNLFGSLAYNNSKSSIYITNITYCGEEDTTKYEKINCTLYEETEKTKIEINKYTYQEKESITLDTFLKKVNFNIENYEKTCKNYTENSLLLEIEAETSENKTTIYKIPLKLEENCNKESAT